MISVWLKGVDCIFFHLEMIAAVFINFGRRFTNDIPCFNSRAVHTVHTVRRI
jgi:hypothetical protein